MLIRPARPADLTIIRDIERAAGLVFRDIGMPDIADDDLPTLAELDEYRRSGRAWVAVDGDDRPVAYLIADRVDGSLHVEQVSVHPAHAHQGIGNPNVMLLYLRYPLTPLPPLPLDFTGGRG